MNLSKLKQEIKKNESVISKGVIFIYRFGNLVYYKIKVPFLRQFLWLIYKFLDFCFVKIVAGADIPATCQIGYGFYLPHGGKGVVLHPKVTLGDNVTLYHQVTIGVKVPYRSERDRMAPKLGNNVLVGAGAKIFGGITIGDYSIVGANSVVITDVPAHSTAVGLPARVIPSKDRKSASL